MAIVSFEHKFIFIKTSKTAGTSIVVDLGRIAGADAIVPPIIPDEAGHQARNYLANDGSARFYNHMSAKLIRDRLGVNTFAGMHKFCVEREPVAKCISHFHMLLNSPIHNVDGQYQKSWQEYCAAGQFPIDLKRYTEIQGDRRVCLVDTILPYEQLDTSLPWLMGRLGVPGFVLISRAKSGYTRQPHVTPDQVTPGQRERIYSAFAETLSLTGMYGRSKAG